MARAVAARRATATGGLVCGLAGGLAVGAVWWSVEAGLNWALGGVAPARVVAAILCLDLAVAGVGGLVLAAGTTLARGRVDLRVLALGLVVIDGLIRIVEPPGFGAEAVFLALGLIGGALGVRLVAVDDLTDLVRVSFVATLAVALATAAFSGVDRHMFARAEPGGLPLVALLVLAPAVGLGVDAALGAVVRPSRVRLGVEVAAAAAAALVLGRPMPTAPLDLGVSSRPAASRTPDVILVVLDTTRADHLSTYGYPRETSPNLTAFARTALTFTEARSPAEWTLPGHASLFTGMYPSRHGAHFAGARSGPSILGRQRVFPLAEERTTLAQILRDRGYATAGFVANFANLDRHFGVAQGFEHYDDAPGVLFRPTPHVVHLARCVRPTFARYPFRTAPEINAAALDWLDRAPRERPVFLFINYLEPHCPLAAPPFDRWARVLRGAGREPPRALSTHVIPARLSAAERAVFAANYDGQIAAMDAGLGGLFAALRARGRYDAALVVVTADHGELLGEHEQVGHGGRTLYEGLLRVPLVVKLPGHDAPRGEVTDPVQLVDVLPTVLGVVGAPVPADVQGQPLRRVAHPSYAEEDINPEFVAAYGRVYDRALAALYDGPYKLIATSRGERMLFDLAHDPGEDDDLATRQPERTAAMAERLEGLRPLGSPAAVARRE